MVMEVQMHTFPRCAEYFIKNEGLLIDEEMQLCYGSHNFGTPVGISLGDFGGPIVLQGFFNEEAVCLTGIASFTSPSCRDPSAPSVFTRVSYFRDWIETAMEEFKPDTAETCTIS